MRWDVYICTTGTGNTCLNSVWLMLGVGVTSSFQSDWIREQSSDCNGADSSFLGNITATVAKIL